MYKDQNLGPGAVKETETKEDEDQEVAREREMMIDIAGKTREVKEDTGKVDRPE